MPARSPQETHMLWADRVAARDLDGLVALYERDAALMPQPGTVVTGQAAVREALAGLLAMQPVFRFEFQRALESGDLALVYSRWTLTGTAPDGTPVNLSGQTSDVVRRQPDASWLFVIDNPFGGAGVEVAPV